MMMVMTIVRLLLIGSLIAHRRRAFAGTGRRSRGSFLMLIDIGEANVRRSNHVLAVLLVVPRVALHSLASNAELFGL